MTALVFRAGPLEFTLERASGFLTIMNVSATPIQRGQCVTALDLSEVEDLQDFITEARSRLFEKQHDQKQEASS